ncbi:hypothetical protein BT63DRAFT_65119 [Microthyrium microscopicum]|uniref:Autophagy-related protein 27 n=1 Tax=Microthyrium microscopicum TaxID=703497 RepID=A0A6A6TZA4_9PEZI|nr:hypothetical protein BT63DRAFT_65119 [Microthyrium microscopicum]
MSSTTSSTQRPTWRTIALILGLASPVFGLGWNCKDIMDAGVHWNLGKLGGKHSVSWQDIQEGQPTASNWTFSLNLCDNLGKEKDVDEKHQCPTNTNICAVERDFDPDKPNEGNATVRKWVAIAGEFSMNTGVHLEVKPTRLKTAGSHADAQREGLRLEMTGGRDPLSSPKGIQQKAVIELVCNKKMTGWEPKEQPKVKSESLAKRDDEIAEALKVVSYGEEDVRGEIWGILRLDWQSQYACEDAADIPQDPSTSWGFFTWFIIILFLSIAAYIIFGSWLNYTRYGARGLDLLPHSDTIRDIPYIVKDILRKAQGSGGSRGGYSAV